MVPAPHNKTEWIYDSHKMMGRVGDICENNRFIDMDGILN